MKRRLLLLAAAGVAFNARAQQSIERWRREIEALLDSDRRSPPRTAGVLFVGSSTVRMWSDLETAFLPQTDNVLRRGVGGSRLADWPELVPLLVWPYRPAQVVVYAGENDIAEGAQPADVLAHFVRLVDAIRAELPSVPIAFVSLKPSPLREPSMPAMREANLLVQRWALTQKTVAYIDVHGPMLDADGRPRRELFLGDGLHLNAAGYALWRQVVSAHLKR